MREQLAFDLPVTSPWVTAQLAMKKKRRPRRRSALPKPLTEETLEKLHGTS